MKLIEGDYIFIGSNGSMGLIHGHAYPVKLRIFRFGKTKVHAKIKDIHRKSFLGKSPDVYCPYSSMKTFEANWRKAEK